MNECGGPDKSGPPCLPLQHRRYDLLGGLRFQFHIRRKGLDPPFFQQPADLPQISLIGFVSPTLKPLAPQRADDNHFLKIFDQGQARDTAEARTDGSESSGEIDEGIVAGGPREMLTQQPRKLFFEILGDLAVIAVAFVLGNPFPNLAFRADDFIECGTDPGSCFKPFSPCGFC